MASTAENKIVAPYVPWETLTDVMAHLKAIAVPGRIDKSALPTNMANLVRGQVQSAFRFLGLVDEKNATKDTLRSLVEAYDTDEWGTVLAQILPKRYANIVGDLDLKDATPHQVDEKFAGVGIAGQMAAKSIRFYLSALSAAGIAYSPHLSRRKQTIRKTRKNTTTKKKKKTTVRHRGENNSGDTPTPPPAGTLSYPIGKRRFMHLPIDLTDADCDAIEAAMPLLRTIAKLPRGGAP